MHCFWILAKLKLTGTYFVQLVHLLLSHPPEKSPQFLSYKNSKYDKCHKLDIVAAGRTNDTSRCRKGRKNVGFSPPPPQPQCGSATVIRDRQTRTHARTQIVGKIALQHQCGQPHAKSNLQFHLVFKMNLWRCFTWISCCSENTHT